jgi:hypothetical protein
MSSNDKVAETLSRFPGPVRLYPSRKKWLLLLAGCTLFSFGGVLMVRSGEIEGWFVLAVFGIGALVPLLVMIPGSGWLLLDEDGFEYRTLFKNRRAHWRDTSNFGAEKIPPANIRLVVYDDIGAKPGMNADLTVKFTGRNSALGDTYGFSAAELAHLMAQWRERAAARSGSR